MRKSGVNKRARSSPRHKLPPRYVQCEVCGEFNGTTDAKNLSWRRSDPPRGNISVTCLCHGIPCKQCGKRIHRPISNEYDPVANQVWHNPYFMGWFDCGECEAKRQKAWDSMPKAEKQRKIAERNRELEALGGFELEIAD